MVFVLADKKTQKTKEAFVCLGKHGISQLINESQQPSVGPGENNIGWVTALGVCVQATNQAGFNIKLCKDMQMREDAEQMAGEKESPGWKRRNCWSAKVRKDWRMRKMRMGGEINNKRKGSSTERGDNTQQLSE